MKPFFLVLILGCLGTGMAAADGMPAPVVVPPASPAAARTGAGPELHLAGRWLVFGDAGDSAYAMTDVNAALGVRNQLMSGLGQAMAPLVAGGLTYGGGAGYWVTDYFQAGAEAESLRVGSVSGNSAIGLDWNFPAVELGGFVRFGGFAWNRLLITGGIGVYYIGLVQAAVAFYNNGFGAPDEHYAYSGSAVGVKIMAGADYFLSDTLALGLDVGYRVADIQQVLASGEGLDQALVVNDDGSRFSIDYSGVYLRGGVKLYF